MLRGGKVIIACMSRIVQNRYMAVGQHDIEARI